VTGSAANQNPFRFSTKRTSNTTELVLYEYRAYSPALGRWPSRDPMEEIGGLNLYGMVENDPIGLVDPVGLYAEPRDNHIYGELHHTDISLNCILSFGDFNPPVTWTGTLFWRKVCCGKNGSKPQNVGQMRYIATLPEFKPVLNAKIEVTAVKTWVKNWIRKKVNKKLQHLVDLIDVDANVELAMNGKFSVHYDGCAEYIRVKGTARTRITGSVGGSVHLGTQDDYAAAGLKGSVTGAGVLYGKGVNTKVEIFLQKDASIDLILSGYGRLVVAKNPLIDESFNETFNVYKSPSDISIVSFDILDYVK